jgi:hypothetical protein
LWLLKQIKWGGETLLGSETGRDWLNWLNWLGWKETEVNCNARLRRQRKRTTTLCGNAVVIGCLRGRDCGRDADALQRRVVSKVN